MSTAATTQHHFPHPIAMAAAATVVIVGGLTAVGVVISQDDSTTPVRSGTSTSHYQGCTDPRCLPPQHRGHSDGRAHQFQPPLKGGHVVDGLP